MPIFVADEVVTAAKLNAATARDWAAWSPSYANLTVGNGVVVARFLEGLGGLVIARFSFVLGSTSAIGTVPTVSAPVTASSSAMVGLTYPCGIAGLRENGAAQRFGLPYLASTTTIAVAALDASAAVVQAANVTATAPFTWGTDDTFWFEAIYEGA